MVTIRVLVLALVFAVSGCVTDELSPMGTGADAASGSAGAVALAPQGGAAPVGTGGSGVGGSAQGGALAAGGAASGGATQGSGGSGVGGAASGGAASGGTPGTGGAVLGGAPAGGAPSGGAVAKGGSAPADCPGLPGFSHQVCDSSGACRAAQCSDVDGAGYCGSSGCVRCPDNSAIGYTSLNCDGNHANGCELHVANVIDPITGRTPSSCADYRRVKGL